MSTAAINVVACESTPKTKTDNRIKEGNIGETDGDDESVIKVRNVLADRHWSKTEMVTSGSLGLTKNSEKVTDQDVIDGINYMNNTALTINDVEVERDNENNMAVVKAKEGSKFYGQNEFYFNKGVKFEDLIQASNLGDIYMPASLPFPPVKEGLRLNVLPQLTLLMEFVGDRNRPLELVVDVIALLSQRSALAPNKFVKIEIDTAWVKLPDNKIMTGEVNFTYKKHDEVRPKIADLITNTDLGKISGTSDEEIIKAVYKANIKNLKKYGEEEMLDALEVFHEKDKNGNERNFIQFKAGNNNFLGHDTASFSVINGSLESGEKFKEEDYQLDIKYS